MKNRIRVLNVLFFILLLALPFQVFAAEQEDDHSHDEEIDEGHEEMDQAEMDAHGHGETDDHGDDGHGDDGHEYEETGANWSLLGSFAAINGGFMLFGAVRKFNKKRKSGVN
ncbi:hypothetical protein RJD24_19075 [Bacillaceae bacterium IKA-2]|nr:hypothetical protein RJD24_19075 [Bacillaceae bacterium IKA-2]